MARLWTCGFEENDTTTLMTMWSITGSPTMPTTPTPHSGSRVLQVDAASTYVARSLSASVTSGTYYHRFYLRWPAAASSSMTIFRTMNSAGTVVGASITAKNTGALSLVNELSSSSSAGSTVLSVDTWYRIELETIIADSPNGFLTMKLFLGDATTDLETLSISNEDTLPTNWSFTQLGRPASTAGTFAPVFDDFALNISNASGFQDSWCGPGKICLRAPSSDSAVAWTKGGSAPEATNWAGVDDVPGTPDDGTTYNFDTTNTNVDKLGMTAMPAEVPSTATMILADTYARVQASGTSQTMHLRMWDDVDSLTNTGNISLANGVWNILTTAQHLVRDLTGKTKANLDSYTVGYKGTTGSVSEKRISALWVNVEWLEATASNTEITVPTAVYSGA